MTSKRERELARAKYERQIQRRAQRETREKMIKLAVSAGVILAVVVGVPVFQNLSKDSAAAPSPTASSVTSLPICQEVGPNRPDTMKFTKVSDNAQAGSALTLKTNCGNIGIALDRRAPKTAAAMSYLANRGFFNQTQCHRLTTQGIYVLQCGDPTATGSGGPGFSFKDENLPAATGELVYGGPSPSYRGLRADPFLLITGFDMFRLTLLFVRVAGFIASRHERFSLLSS